MSMTWQMFSTKVTCHVYDSCGATMHLFFLQQGIYWTHINKVYQDVNLNVVSSQDQDDDIGYLLSACTVLD